MKKQNLILSTGLFVLVALVASQLLGGGESKAAHGLAAPGGDGEVQAGSSGVALDADGGTIESGGELREAVQATGKKPDAKAAPVMGVIHGRVLDDLESPFGDCAVFVRRKGKRGDPRVDRDMYGRPVAIEDQVGVVRVSVDASGRFELNVSPGIYGLIVDPKSLPEGFVGPFERINDKPGHQGRYEQPMVEVTPEGLEVEAVLHVLKQALMYGRVVGANGQPVEGAYIDARYAGEGHAPNGNLGEAQTNANGDFEVRVAVAGNYRLSVLDGLEHPLWKIPPPILELTVESGGVYPVGTLRAGGDDITVTGRVLNQDGDPFVGASVHFYPDIPKREGWRPAYNENDYGRTTTDADGYFTVTDLPSARIKISTYADWEKPLGERKVATWWTPILIDLSDKPASATVDIGEHMTPESRPFYLTVHYEVDDDWFEAHSPPLKSKEDAFFAFFRPATPLPDTSGMSHEEQFLAIGGRTLRMDDDDPFIDRWISDALPGPYILHIGVEDDIFKPVEYPIEIYPNGKRELTVQIPPK